MGITTIVNLAPQTMRYNEADCAKEYNMDYFEIPIDMFNPSKDCLQTFKMIIDDVIWEVINNGQCAFKRK